jgi:hypothetical protein
MSAMTLQAFSMIHLTYHTVTQSSFDAPCTPLYGGTDWLVRLIPSNIPRATCFLICLRTTYRPCYAGNLTYDDDLPTREFIVEDVRVPFKLELTVLSDRFLTRRNPSGSIVARLQTLRPPTAAKVWFPQ